MKRFGKTLFLLSIIAVLSFDKTLHAELLIVKKTNQGFAPLNESDDKKKSTLESIAFNYQWPMIIANTRPTSVAPRVFSATREHLLTPNISDAESNIQIGMGRDYAVIFFPNSLYELFAVFEILNTQYESNPLQTAITKVCQRPDGGRIGSGNPTFAQIIDSGDTPTKIRQSIIDEYDKINRICLEKKDTMDSAYGHINKQLTAWLFNEYPALKDGTSESDLSNFIENKTEDLIIKLINRLKSLPEDKLIFKNARSFQERSLAEKFVHGVAAKDSKEIITACTALEYEAQRLNKGLLLRGTEFVTQNDKKIAGSTVKSTDLAQDYKEKKIDPYSISFGNYLFAGILREHTSCAYSFLTGSFSTAPKAKTGYALLINKAEYVETNNANLFFIPPLCSLASLFTLGDWFHARTKAAVAIKNPKQPVYISGLFDVGLVDPTGVLLITRDPLKHAALFSQFLADNGRIIQLGDSNELTPDEKKFAEDILQAQKETSGYYKGVKGMKPIWETVLPKVRENLASQKGAESTKVTEPVTDAKQ